jgi:fumarate reductase flavoprotein subunit
MMEGGLQVNLAGQRFWNEHQGYSEASQHVIAQPGGVAWNLYDARLHALGSGFPDYGELAQTGAVKSAPTIAALARETGLPEAALAATLAEVGRMQAGALACRFGRDFSTRPALAAPYYAVKVTGALFHTQGGLAISPGARVLRADGTPLPNLWAGGGAARGVSGAAVWGYLSGNGLLTAVTLGASPRRAAAGPDGTLRRLRWRPCYTAPLHASA